MCNKKSTCDAFTVTGSFAEHIEFTIESMVISRRRARTSGAFIFKRMKQSSGRYTSSKYSQISPRVVVSILALTSLARFSLVSSTNAAVITGVEMSLTPSIISLILGTPWKNTH